MLVTYRETIQAACRKFNWSSVYIYDQKFRAQLAESRYLSYDSIDHDLYVTIFNTDALRSDAIRCFRCKSYDHVVIQCPFPARPAEKQAKQEVLIRHRNTLSAQVKRRKRDRQLVYSTGDEHTRSQPHPAPTSLSSTAPISPFSSTSSQLYTAANSNTPTDSATETEPRRLPAWAGLVRG